MRLLPLLLALALLPLVSAPAQSQGGPLVPPARGFGGFQTLFHVPMAPPPTPPTPPALAPGSSTAAAARPAPALPWRGPGT